jgi:hypothetical protein
LIKAIAVSLKPNLFIKSSFVHFLNSIESLGVKKFDVEELALMNEKENSTRSRNGFINTLKKFFDDSLT